MQPTSPVIPGLESLEITIAKDQPPYRAVNALRSKDGRTVIRLDLRAEELQKILDGASVYLCLLTFNQPMTPFMCEVAHPVTDSPENILGMFGLAQDPAQPSSQDPTKSEG